MPRDDDSGPSTRTFAASGLLFFVSQLAVFGVGRPPSWDEAVYLSQVMPGVPAAAFVASRARGIVVLAAPVAGFTTSVWPVRLFLAAASAAAIAFAFARWRDLIGGRAALFGMWLFMGSWVTAFYGSAAAPNLWMAIACVAATAAMVRSLRAGGSRRKLVIELSAVALAAALMRPFDAVILAAALSLYAVFRYWKQAGRAVVCLLGGTSVGLLAWLLETSIRYGGLGAALEAGRSYGHVGHGIGVVGALRLTDGPLLGPDANTAFPAFGVIAAIALLVLVILGVRASRNTDGAEPVRLASAAGAVLIAAYLFFVWGAAPRFFLPGIALLCVPAGLGAAWIAKRGRAATIALLVLAVCWLGWQIDVGRTVADGESRSAAAVASVGEHIRAIDKERPCVLLSWFATPQIAFAARCLGADLNSPVDPSIERLVTRAPMDGRAVFLVGSSDREIPAWMVSAGVTPIRIAPPSPVTPPPDTP
ncbi:MAG: hypothetical protein QOE83_856 [Actinomycetota bacterium]|jgi:hypothetical protein|nr:hypothetical protein [Actinomycetota bacterium]